MRDIQVLDTPLNTQSCHDAVVDPAAGGIVVFVGTVRNQTKGRNRLRGYLMKNQV